jgi:hypothetical protein
MDADPAVTAKTISFGNDVAGYITDSIVDAAEAGTAPDQVIAAVGQALDRGLATESQFAAEARERAGRVERLLRRAVDEWGGA